MPKTVAIKRAPSLRAQAYSHLKSLILSNQLPPGTPLVEEQLAVELGISRTPLREVLASLEREGLVMRVLNRGTVVTDISTDDINNIYEIRELLERYAAARATKAIPQTELLPVKVRFETAAREIKRGKYELYYESHRDLHHLILRYSNNPLLSQILDTMSERIQRIRAFAGQSPERHVKEAHKEQLRLLKALLARNPVAAESAIADHLHNAKQRIVGQLREANGYASDAKPSKPSNGVIRTSKRKLH